MKNSIISIATLALVSLTGCEKPGSNIDNKMPDSISVLVKKKRETVSSKINGKEYENRLSDSSKRILILMPLLLESYKIPTDTNACEVTYTNQITGLPEKIYIKLYPGDKKHSIKHISYPDGASVNPIDAEEYLTEITGMTGIKDNDYPVYKE